MEYHESTKNIDDQVAIAHIKLKDERSSFFVGENRVEIVKSVIVLVRSGNSALL
jgi:hypothetical protein